MDVAGHRELKPQALAQAIAEVGLRVTQPRLAVLSLLHELGGHRSADEIVAELRARDSKIPRTSVFNVLNDLARSGLLRVADAGPGRALYEVAGHWHHHFVCRDCGAICDVPCVEGERPCIEPAPSGFVVDEAQIIFRGRCPFMAGEAEHMDTEAMRRMRAACPRARSGVALEQTKHR